MQEPSALDQDPDRRGVGGVGGPAWFGCGHPAIPE